MVVAALLAFREGLEAALIVGIVLGVLRQLQQHSRRRSVWLGVAVAAVLSAGVGIGLYSLGVSFEGRAEEIFEGVAMLLAAGVLTWMIFWMDGQGRSIQTGLEGDVKRATSFRGGWGLFWISFLAVLREGIELALFLTAAAFSNDPGSTLMGGVLGLGAATVVGWVFFTTSSRMHMNSFFRVTSILLLLFAAGLVAHGIHEFNEAGIVPSIIEQLWDINPILNEASGVGQVLKSLLGYNGNPSLTEVAAYGFYLVTVTAALLWSRKGIARVPSNPMPAACH